MRRWCGFVRKGRRARRPGVPGFAAACARCLRCAVGRPGACRRRRWPRFRAGGVPICGMSRRACARSRARCLLLWAWFGVVGFRGFRRGLGLAPGRFPLRFLPLAPLGLVARPVRRLAWRVPAGSLTGSAACRALVARPLLMHPSMHEDPSAVGDGMQQRPPNSPRARAMASLRYASQPGRALPRSRFSAS